VQPSRSDLQVGRPECHNESVRVCMRMSAVIHFEA